MLVTEAPEMPSTPERFKNRLSHAATQVQRSGLAEGTMDNLRTYLSTYEQYCQDTGDVPFNMSTKDLPVYAIYLALRLKSVDSIINYVSGLCTLHRLVGVRPPDTDYYKYHLTLDGLRRWSKFRRTPAEPMTVDLLLSMSQYVNLNEPFQLAAWAAILTAFHTTVRNSNLVPNTLDGYDMTKQLARGDFVVSKLSMLVHIKWAKNNQHGDKNLMLPIFQTKNSPICAVTVLKRLFDLVPGKVQDSAFMYPALVKGQLVMKIPTYQQTLKYMRQLIQSTGIDPKPFSMHSLRHGAASWMAANGVPGELIKLYGGWASSAYLTYVNFPLQTRSEIALKLSKTLS